MIVHSIRPTLDVLLPSTTNVLTLELERFMTDVVRSVPCARAQLMIEHLPSTPRGSDCRVQTRGLTSLPGSPFLAHFFSFRRTCVNRNDRDPPCPF